MTVRFRFVIGCVLCLTAWLSVRAAPPPGWDSASSVPPAAWLATPEGRFAHSINIPNPVPKESGYRKGMTPKEYYDHLCATEAGEFIFKTVDNVEGFYFMRPPKRWKDDDLFDPYLLESPSLETPYTLREGTPQARARKFVDPPWVNYEYLEEPNPELSAASGGEFLRMHGYVQRQSAMQVEPTRERRSRYSFTWRGIRRPFDRENGVAGSELLVLDSRNDEVLAVLRVFAWANPSQRKDQISLYWLNALTCPNPEYRYRYNNGQQLEYFIQAVLKPKRQQSRYLYR